MDKILFLSSNTTGSGHRSITQALYYQLKKINPEVSIEEQEAFSLGGGFTKVLAKMYNKVAVFAPKLWGHVYKISNKFALFINFSAEHIIKRKFIRLIKQINPDLIVTVHPGFVGSINNILKKNGINIPVIVVVADFDNITKIWADKNTLYTLCPTKESYNSMLKYGVSEDRLKLFGFPVRDEFNHIDSENVEREIACDIDNKRINFLIMNGSEGEYYSKRIAENLLENFDCNVTILAGKDAILKNTLEHYLKTKYEDRVEVYGFTDKVQYYMMKADILLVRASPNVLMEAINLCKPIIITGSFTGQEEKNPEFIINNKLGIECKDINSLIPIVDGLIADNGKKLKEIKRNQLEFRKPNAAYDMAKFIINQLK